MGNFEVRYLSEHEIGTWDEFVENLNMDRFFIKAPGSSLSNSLILLQILISLVASIKMGKYWQVQYYPGSLFLKLSRLLYYPMLPVFQEY